MTSPAMQTAGIALMVAATIFGAQLARRSDGHRRVWFGGTAGALLVIALVHLLPDAWASAQDNRVPATLTPLVAVGSFAATFAIGRTGCACKADEEQYSGTGSAAALTLHRCLEGAALAMTGFVAAAALAAHALGEGLAIGALLRAKPRRLTAWVVAMCFGSAVGVAAANAFSVLESAEPFPLAAAAGVLAQTAWVSLRAAFPPFRAGPRITAAPVSALLVAASFTALATFAT